MSEVTIHRFADLSLNKEKDKNSPLLIFSFSVQCNIKLLELKCAANIKVAIISVKVKIAKDLKQCRDMDLIVDFIFNSAQLTIYND